MIESDNPLMESAWHLGPSKFNVWCLVIGIIVAGVTETYRYKMSNKNEKTQNGKGDKSRISDKKKYDANYEKIFGVDIGRVNGDGSQLGLSNHRYDGDGTEWIYEVGEDKKLYKRAIGSGIKILVNQEK